MTWRAMCARPERAVHTTFEDGGEMVEEYDLKTDELMVRKRR